MLKRCTGPRHEGEYIPIDRFYFYKTGEKAGRPVGKCRDCQGEMRGMEHSGWVEIERVRFVLEELIRRVGKAEASRLMGYAREERSLRRLFNGDYKRMQKRFAVNAIRALRQLRDNDVVWHKDSIRRGAKLRGEPVKRPQARGDYYINASDDETDKRNEFRKKQIVSDPTFLVRESERAKIRRRKAA